MALPRLSQLELRIMQALWSRGALSIREIQEAFPERRPAYTTVQTTVYLSLIHISEPTRPY